MKFVDVALPDFAVMKTVFRRSKSCRITWKRRRVVDVPGRVGLTEVCLFSVSGSKVTRGLLIHEVMAWSH